MTSAEATLRCCPNCWHLLERFTVSQSILGPAPRPHGPEPIYRRCPRCRFTETLAGALVQPARHCATCTCSTA